MAIEAPAVSIDWRKVVGSILRHGINRTVRKAARDAVSVGVETFKRQIAQRVENLGERADRGGR